jgi:MFS-type transporter involved in bile tolerance (Atg22 family)
MQVDLGMDEGQLAELNLYTTVVAALGCVIGGWVSDRLGHRRMLAVWYGLTTIPTFWLSGQFTGAAGMEGVTIAEYYRVAILYNFTSGLLQGTAIAVFMGLTSPLVAGTQFTGYMALKNIVYSYSSIWQGRMADVAGYAATIRLDALIAFGPMLMLPFLVPSTRSRKD